MSADELPIASLGGVAAPEDLAADLALVAALPIEARRHFWEALGPSLAEPIAPEVERRLDVFCAEHRVASGDLARAIKACRALLRGAARFAVTRAAFEADLIALAAPADAATILAAGFANAMLTLRRAAALAAIGGHGNVVTQIDWRVDRVLDADRIKDVGIDLTVVTLKYREGDATRSITLHLLPEMVEALRNVGRRVP